jgi:phosphoribosylaminoimidazole-succinocarboxamide synthase
VELIEAGYAADRYEHPEDPDEKMLLVATDRFVSPGWPAKRSIMDLGRVRTAISTVIYEHLQGRFATAYLGPGDQMLGRTMEMRWYEPVPISIMVLGTDAALQGLNERDRSLLQRLDLHPSHASDDEQAVPVVWPARSQQLPTEAGLLDEQTTSSLVKASLVQSVRLSALLLYADLSTWYASHGISLSAIRFDFGVTGDELLLVGEVGLLEFMEANLAGSADDDPVGKAALRRLSSSMARPGGPRVDEVSAGLLAHCVEFYERLSGQQFSDWVGQPSSYDGYKIGRRILGRRW